MTKNEKLAELYAQFAKEKDVHKLTQITNEIAGVLAAKEQRVKQLHDEIRAVGMVSNPPTPSRGTTEPVPPSFGGKPGEPVPQVDPQDVKTLWEMSQETERRHPGVQAATGVAVLEQVCKPGANIRAVTYRSSMIWVLRHSAPEVLEPWTKEDQLDDVIFRTMAEIPMEWIGVGVSRQGLPFDVEDFVRRLRG
jgi:hypothetical protein